MTRITPNCIRLDQQNALKLPANKRKMGDVDPHLLTIVFSVSVRHAPQHQIHKSHITLRDTTPKIRCPCINSGRASANHTAMQHEGQGSNQRANTKTDTLHTCTGRSIAERVFKTARLRVCHLSLLQKIPQSSLRKAAALVLGKIATYCCEYSFSLIFLQTITQMYNRNFRVVPP